MANASDRPLRVLLADDELVTLEGVRIVLETADDISVVGEAHTAHELCPMVARTRPDLVLVDPQIAGFDDEGFGAILREDGDLTIVAFSASTDPVDIDAALQAGAAAYVVKNIHPLDLPTALRATAERAVFHSARPEANGSGPAASATDLTEREIEILAAVARGLPNKLISRELGVSDQTVKFHLANVYRKLSVPNRTAAVRYAHEHRIVTVGRRR